MKKLNFIKPLVIGFIAALLTVGAVDAAVTYTTAVKTARMTAVRDQIDLGTGAGTLEIGPTGLATVCVTVTLNDPSGTVTGNTLSLSGFPKTVTASATCTAGEARIRDSSGTNVITGLTVGTSGTDVIVTNTSINSGQSVTVNATPTFVHS